LRSLSHTAGRILSGSPGDARGYSVLGAVEERAGNVAGAHVLYALALDHSKSELHALLRTARAKLEQADTAGALENIDLLLRRWPNYWEQVQPVLLEVASNEDRAVHL